MSETYYIDSIAIVKGIQGMYYIVEGEKYDINFPLKWALCQNPIGEIPEIPGPKHCENCKTYGSINEVFVAYCKNCATIYNGEREGILGNAYVAREVLDSLSYMKGVSIADIGDTEFPMNEGGLDEPAEPDCQEEEKDQKPDQEPDQDDEDEDPRFTYFDEPIFYHEDNVARENSKRLKLRQMRAQEPDMMDIFYPNDRQEREMRWMRQMRNAQK